MGGLSLVQLVSCVCKLCDGAAPLCAAGLPSDDLAQWLQAACGFAEASLAELLGALRGAGAQTMDDLRFVQDATVTELPGRPA